MGQGQEDEEDKGEGPHLARFVVFVGTVMTGIARRKAAETVHLIACSMCMVQSLRATDVMAR